MKNPIAVQETINQMEEGVSEQVSGEVKEELLDIMYQLYTRSHNETFMKLGRLYDLLCGKDV